MATVHASGSGWSVRRAFRSRWLAALAAAVAACSDGSGSSSHPSGGTAPSIAGLWFAPQTALVGDGGGAASVNYHVMATDPDADFVQIVATVVDGSGAPVSKVVASPQLAPGATSAGVDAAFTVPTAAAGTFTVEVQGFDATGRGSNVLRESFSVVEPNPVPAITALSPPSAPVWSGALTLAVEGSGFMPSSTVLWNGSSLATTYVDGAKLEAQLPSSYLYFVGTASVAVSNPPPGGGASAPATFVVEAGPPPEPNPAPEIASLLPESADAGTAFTLTVTGSGFTASSVVYWNGSSLSTTRVSSTTLTASVESYDTASPGTVSVTVRTPSPGGGTSAALPFTIARPEQPGVQFVSLRGNDLAWDPYQRRIYVSVPSTSPVNPNTVTVLDPFTGTLGDSQFVGSEPGRLALSDDGQLLYVALRGASSVERLWVPSLTPDLSIPLGRDATNGAYVAADVQVAPGAPSTIAVSLSTLVSYGGSGALAIFDDSTARATRATSSSSYPWGSIQWGTTASAVYATGTGYGNDLYAFAVDASGVALQSTYRSAFTTYAEGLRLDPGTGLLYAEDGRALDPTTGVLAGTYVAPSTYLRRVAPDSSLGSVFFVGNADIYGYGTSQTVSAYDLTGYYPTGSLTIPFAGSSARGLVRWGTDGLAFLTTDAVVLVRGDIVLPPATTPNPAPVVTSVSPASASAGAPNLTVTVTGEGFVPGSTVLWNGSERTTRFVGSTALVAYVPASDVAAAGSAEIIVATPSPGGGTSTAATFTIAP